MILQPPNITTIPAKKGKVGKFTTFEAFPEHRPDDIDNEKVHRRKLMKLNKAKE